MEEGTVSDAQNLCSARPTPSSGPLPRSGGAEITYGNVFGDGESCSQTAATKMNWNTENGRTVEKKSWLTFDVITPLWKNVALRQVNLFIMTTSQYGDGKQSDDFELKNSLAPLWFDEDQTKRRH